MNLDGLLRHYTINTYVQGGNRTNYVAMVPMGQRISGLITPMTSPGIWFRWRTGISRKRPSLISNMNEREINMIVSAQGDDGQCERL